MNVGLVNKLTPMIVGLVINHDCSALVISNGWVLLSSTVGLSLRQYRR